MLNVAITLGKAQQIHQPLLLSLHKGLISVKEMPLGEWEATGVLGKIWGKKYTLCKQKRQK